ncbi:MAG: hypothetical protein IJ754_04290 [Bacteroidaceae bacterium]|nr:hypothetical protein [Bacteroidaceae bacterium]
MNNKQLNILRSTYLFALMTAIVLIIIFEVGLLPIGTRAYDSMSNYTCEMIGVFLTIICIPVALKLMSFGWIKRQLSIQPDKYFTLSIVRISLLTVPLLYDTIFYYLLGEDATLGYLALMDVIAFLFIWPSQGKMEYELENANKQQEK